MRNLFYVRDIVKRVSVISLALLLLALLALSGGRGFSVSGDQPAARNPSGIHQPFINELDILFMPSVSTQIAALQAGDIQMASNLDPDSAKTLNGTNNILVSAPEGFVPLQWYMTIGPTGQSSPGVAYALKDPQFRLALRYMLGDRQWLHTVFGDLVTPWTGSLGPAWGNFSNTDLKNPPQNFTEANKILDAAGYKINPSTGWRDTPQGQPINIQIDVPTFSAQVSQIGAIAANWGSIQLHVQMTVVPVNLPGWVNAAISKNFDILLGGGGAYLTRSLPEYVLTVFYRPPFDVTNTNGTDFGQLMTQLDNAPTRADAIKYSWAIQKWLFDNNSNFYLGWVNNPTGLRTDKFTGWVPLKGWGVWHNEYTYVNLHLKNGQPGGTYVAGHHVEPAVSNPVAANFDDVSANIFGKLVYDQLIRDYGPTDPFKLTPDLASSWSSQPATVNGTAGQILTFNLVHNATWHDGVPFTSADVKYTFQLYQKSPSLVNSGIFKDIVQMDTPDNYTFVIHLASPSYWAFFVLGYPQILPQHIWSKISDPYTYPNPDPIGTGPFKFVSWSHGQSLTLQANTNYFYQVPLPSVVSTSAPTTSSTSPAITTSATSPTTTSTGAPPGTTAGPDYTIPIIASVLIAVIIIGIAIAVVRRRK